MRACGWLNSHKQVESALLALTEEAPFSKVQEAQEYSRTVRREEVVVGEGEGGYAGANRWERNGTDQTKKADQKLCSVEPGQNPSLYGYLVADLRIFTWLKQTGFSELNPQKVAGSAATKNLG